MTTLGTTAFPACTLDAEGMATRAAEFRALLSPNRRACVPPFWRFSPERRASRLVRLNVRAEAPDTAALEAFPTFTGFVADPGAPGPRARRCAEAAPGLWR